MEALILLVGLVIALVGAVLLLAYGIVPALTGGDVNTLLAAFGAVLIVIGIAFEVLLGSR